MARRNLNMSNLKEELAEELGVDNTVRNDGWGSVSSRACGNLVKLAIERAERATDERIGKQACHGMPVLLNFDYTKGIIILVWNSIA